MWLEEPQVTRARILVARGTDADLKLALQILEALDEIAERTHNIRYKIEILALCALALDGQGQTGEANAVLKQAMDLARPGGFIRIFLDFGRPMYQALQRIADQNHSGDAIQRLLAAFMEGVQGQRAGDQPARMTADPLASNLTLIEPLTPRELEILNLLRGSEGVKEIALALHLSPATVKRHINNIYAKLGVNKRWHAVARAEELNILPPR
jgi:LuxR family maltose regulon positive regulatory protein